MRFHGQAQYGIAWLIFLTTVTTFLVLALYFPQAYVFATYEDLVGEWAQAFGFLIAFVLAVGIVRTRGPYRWFFLLLALACLYTFLEEISWGQRLIGFSTPTLLKEHNLQGEANIHNLLVGPIATTTKTLVEWTLACALAGYGVVYPWLLRLGWKPAIMLDRMGIPAPPLYLSAYFLTAAALELQLFRFNEAEIAELLVAFALVLFTSSHLYARRHALDTRASGQWQRRHSNRLAFMMAALIACVLALAAGTTYLEYQSASMRNAMESRLLRGYEKFAIHYGNYGRWDIAARLYITVQEMRGPDNPYYLYKIAECFHRMGNEVLAGIYTKRARAAATHEDAGGPRDVSAYLSLARTYQHRGDEETASRYAERATEIAQDEVERNPGSATSAYWLGEAYQQLGDDKAALDQYRKAAGLEPSSLQYRQRYQELQKSIGLQNRHE